MKNFLAFLSVILCLLVVAPSANSQGFLKKVKSKLKEAGDEIIDESVDDALGIDNPSGNTGTNTGTSPGNSGNTDRSGRPTNEGGGGLIVTPPDVAGSISEASTAYASNKYSDARYAIQQAIIGVEMEMGHKLLESLPTSVKGIPAKMEEDEVTSSGIGLVGLAIKRAYYNDNQSVDITVANNSGWLSMYNLYASNPSYSGSNENMKSTKVQGYKGLIEYNESSGYSVGVPVGQSSVVIWKLVNFKSESEVMSAVNTFSIDEIKDILGEK